jgi:hypothetical protein
MTNANACDACLQLATVKLYLTLGSLYLCGRCLAEINRFCATISERIPDAPPQEPPPAESTRIESCGGR